MICYCTDCDEQFDTDYDVDTHRYCPDFIPQDYNQEDYVDWLKWKREIV